MPSGVMVVEKIVKYDVAYYAGGKYANGVSLPVGPFRYSLTSIPLSRKYSFASLIEYWRKWKMEAARAASAWPSAKPS